MNRFLLERVLKSATFVVVSSFIVGAGFGSLLAQDWTSPTVVPSRKPHIIDQVDKEQELLEAQRRAEELAKCWSCYDRD